ncbi:hypoxanthine phosphoribosyltransferase [Smithella sp. SC_K08D17]|jgi:hypoxanthine phosphoribosyltransferase|nr:hypoxanthine phosphoribosyltransferase [Smithella sp. D17]KIE18034.1 hypoxanthine phosphoribosyltransferase [Smithella sp. SC_K08D17]MDD5344534.1 hypoxanthine phosphoribosyltransferase [Smithella sp.]MDD5524138.1 hypoxanthine phosphoribosyltransferase [Smithella sp.]
MDQISKQILFSRDEIQKRVREIASQISKDYAGRELVVIGILKGAFIFMADLVRELSVPCKVDFVRVASYGAGSESSGKVVMTKDIETSIKGRDILIVEDIVDSGLTLQYLVNWLKERNPHSLKICVFLDKRKRRKVSFEADYAGFTIDDGFVVGYGLDFDEQFRFFPDVYIIEQ